MEAQAVEMGDDMKLNISSFVKPLHKVIADNKDIGKAMTQLSSVIVMHRTDVQKLINAFNGYDELWTTVATCRLSVVNTQ